MKLPVSLRACLPLLLFAVTCSLWAQNVQPRPVSRIAPNADLSPVTRLSGNLPRWVTTSADQGAVPEAMPLRISLVLSRSPEMEDAFTQLLADQQNPSSPRYHQWLTPAQIGQQFGPTTDDVNAVTAWLTRQGLEVVSVSPSRVFVEATGTAATVGAALGTSFHHFLLDGQPRLSATSEPAIPSALAVAVGGIQGLTEIPIQSFHTAKPAESRPEANGVRPMATANSTTYYLFPGDFAKIYDVPTSSGVPYPGAGARVAIIGRSQVANIDITQLETRAGLPANVPNVIVVPGSPDPGQTKDENQGEATLDVERVMTTAPGAQADLVIAGSTTNTDGLTQAMLYNVNTLLDPVMSISFGNCEASAGPSNVSYYDALFKQGAAEGISTFVSSGDSGAAGCSASFGAATGKETLGMNFLCSSTYVTCVGGTEFNDVSNYAQYWSATNSSTYTSAFGYIPEGAWNEPVGLDKNGAPFNQLASTGGGTSLYIAKPSWQAGTGVPADGKRDTPDISFTAANHDGYYGCESFKGAAYDCSKSGGAVFSGTSASAPGMAAVAAILIQKTGKSWGNLNPTLYGLAATTPTAFHDATIATSGVSSCTAATASMCDNSTPSPSSLSGLAGFALQTGYDLATGLGSLDVTNFVNAAAALPQTTPTLTVSAAPATITTAQSVVFTATLAGTGSGTPTGAIRFFSGSTLLSAVPVSGGKASTAALTFATAGTYQITAVYSGDTTYASVTSAAIAFVVTAPPGSVTISSSPTTLSLAAGSTTGNTTAITVSSVGNYAGTVALTCSVSYSGGTATYPPTCALAPASVSVTAAAPGSSVLTLTTTVPHAQKTVNAAGIATGFAGLSLAGLLMVLLPAGRRRRLSLGLMVLLLSAGLGALSGCGGSSGSNTTPTPTPIGTSTGTYTVLITATATGINTSTSVTLTVR